jgi:F420-dependent oxidoreductase-like protein
MIEVAIMVEGQNGLNWNRWQRIVRAVEDFGFVGLYRSDHFTNADPPDRDSLELWVSLTWLAANTQRIEFGPLVTPVSFRHPTLTSRMAAAVDDLSGGRLTLGVGAGWQGREHTNFGWELLDLDSRFQRFEEGLKVISLLLHSDVPIHFKGQYYQLNEAILLPRPTRPGGPLILVGGNSLHRTLPLAARFADEWNAVYITKDEFIRRNQRLDQLLLSRGRTLDSLRRSMMTGCVLGRDELDVRKKVEARTQGRLSEHDLRQRGLVVGTSVEIVDQLHQLSDAGVQRVMLQWLDLDDIPGLEALAKGVLPQLK